jgi:DUF4097 and DUF4098 domain-containing protein YvlB
MKTLYFEETIPTDKSFLVVNVEVGSVQIRPHNGRQVTVTAEIENCTVTVNRQGSIVYVEAHIDKETPSSWLDHLLNGHFRTKANLVIHVPATCEIKARTITGNLDIREIDAPISINVITGKANLADIGGAVYAKLVTGRLDYEGNLANASHRFETTTGNIRLRLLKEPNAQLNATTTTGNIHCDFPLINGAKSKTIVGGKIRGTLGSGEGKLKAKVTTGSLRLEQA